MTLYVRAINNYGAAAVAMLFAVIPAVAGLLSWLMLGQRPDVGIAVGLVVGAAACWLNARVSRQQRQRSVASPTASIMRRELARDVGPRRLIDEFGHSRLLRYSATRARNCSAVPLNVNCGSRSAASATASSSTAVSRTR